MNLGGVNARAAVKGIENVRNLGGVNADSLVRDRDAQLRRGSAAGVGGKSLQRDVTIIAPVLDCISDQVLKALGNPAQVARDVGRPSFRG